MSASKRRGTAFETAVVTYLREQGFPFAERRALQGTKDRGDVAGIPGWVLECKSEVSVRLALYMNELQAELANDGARWGAAVVKRRGKGIAEAYAVMPLRLLLKLMEMTSDAS